MVDNDTLTHIITQIGTSLPSFQIYVSQDRIWGQYEENSDFTDLETALIPFLRLDGKSAVSIEIPNEVWNNYKGGDSTSESVKTNFDSSTGGSVPQNGSIEASASSCDHMSRLRMLVQEINQGASEAYFHYVQALRYMQMHSLLDNLPGPTASILRRGRFACWSREYECGYRNIITYDKYERRNPATRWRKSSSNWDRSTTEFVRRREDFGSLNLEMRAWNPWSIDLYKTPDEDAEGEEWRLYNAVRTLNIVWQGTKVDKHPHSTIAFQVIERLVLRSVSTAIGFLRLCSLSACLSYLLSLKGRDGGRRIMLDFIQSCALTWSFPRGKRTLPVAAETHYKVRLLSTS